MSGFWRTPSISTMSFSRAADASSGIRMRASIWARMILEGKNPQQEAIESVGPADGIAHHAFSIHPQFKLGEANRLHAVGDVDIGGADHSAHGNGLVFGVDQDVLGSFHNQAPVGKHGHNARRENSIQ